MLCFSVAGQALSVPLLALPLLETCVAQLSYCFALQEFVEGLDGIPKDAKQALKQLTPATYIGNAVEQARQIVAKCNALE